MRRLPWHVAVRPDRRAAWTAGGIALGVAFALVGLAVPEGLRLETVSPEGPFGRQDAIVSLPGLAPVDAASLRLDNATLVLLVRATLADGAGATLAALEGPRGVDVAPGEARAPGRSWGDVIEVAAPARATFLTGDPPESPLVARGWIVIQPSAARELDASLADGRATYLSVPGLPAARAAELRDAGYLVDAAPGVEPFFRASTAEVAQGLLLVVGFSCILVGLFTYEFLRTEVRARRREIAVWRAVGMTGRDVASLLLGRALLLGVLGTIAGALVAVAALLAAAGATDSGVFAGRLDAATVLALAAFPAAALVGAFVPARAAARGAVRGQAEAAS